MKYLNFNGLVLFLDKLKEYINKKISDINNKLNAIPAFVEITYADLKSIADNNQLIPGQQYRIIDYKTTTSAENTISAGHDFDIIVTADSTNILNEVVRAIQHDGDTYFSNQDLKSWKLWYCLDNDNVKYNWADTTNGKGVIYRMIDDCGNDCPYDFKNIMFNKRYVNEVFNNNPDEYCYTFTNKSTTGEITDKSLTEATNNKIGIFTNNREKVYRLPFNIFYNKPLDSTNTNEMCYNNVIGNNSHHNFFDSGCICNTLETYCTDNYFGFFSRYNHFGIGCIGNYLGNEAYYNSFAMKCEYNNFGDNCYGNTLMNYCRYNEMGKGCSYNVFNSCAMNNSFRTGNTLTSPLRPFCKFNTFGSGCRYLILYNGSTTGENYSLCCHTAFPGVMGSTTTPLAIAISVNPTSLYTAKGTNGLTINKQLGDLT